jgi:hypothetical protein
MCHVINNTIHFINLILSYLDLWSNSNTFQFGTWVDGTPANIMMHLDTDPWCSCKHHDVCQMLILGTPANITMCARCWSLVLLQASQCVPDGLPLVLLQTSWCMQTLILGTTANITMCARCLPLVLLQTLWCVPGADPWYSCKHHDACKHWSLVLLQTSQCVPGANPWYSCKHHNVCQMLALGTFANIIMYANTDPWYYCKHHDVCQMLALGTSANITMCARC